MAQAKPAQMEEIPLIEEHVETGLKALLDGYRATYVPGGEVKDELLGRFTLYPSRALPQFDNAFAKAYEAKDDFNPTKPIYAMVCDNSMPIRQHAVNEMTALINPHLTTLMGAGVVSCSHLGESRMVLFIEVPRGTRLSEMLKTQTRFHEHKVIDFILQPAVKALMAMREKRVTHGHIHPGNFYYSDTSQLGECYTAPCSTQGHYIYEPLERLMAQPLGRGEATEKSDVYSLAIMAYELMYGLDKIKAIPKETYIAQSMSLGVYNIFAAKRDFSDTFQDFFRGILNENPAERWGLDQLLQWINGKRFNMIAPTAPKEAARPINFVAEDFLSRRLFADALHSHWREALKDIKGLKIDRWCEASLHRPELAEKIDRAMRGAGPNATDAQLNDALTRIINVLDPSGPLRSRAFSLRPDAIGTVLADVIQHNGAELAQLLSFIENDLGNYWSEQIDSNKTPEMSAMVFRLQKAKGYLKNKAIGFGLERVLYELNPSLCCQSPLLKSYHVTTALDLLKTLDAIAPTLAPDTSFVDRHIAAFLASKIDMGKEIRLHDLATVPVLAENQELIMLRLLSKAQQKTPKLPLVGLCGWAATRVERMIDTIHNRIIRKRLKLILRKLALTGSLSEVLTAIINLEVSHRDLDGFSKAIALHQFNHDRMERLKNPDILAYKARRAGGKMAMVVSYTAFVITSYITLTHMFGI